MKLQIAVGLVAVLVLTGCQSRYNPTNWGWGGGGTQTLAPSDGYDDTSDQRPLVSQVVSVDVEDVPGGVIVHAVGLPPTIGYWAADLVPSYETVTGKPATKDGIMWLEFRAIYPLEDKPTVTPAAREISAALFLSDQTLRDSRQVVVVAQNNQRAAGR